MGRLLLRKTQDTHYCKQYSVVTHPSIHVLFNTLLCRTGHTSLQAKAEAVNKFRYTTM